MGYHLSLSNLFRLDKYSNKDELNCTSNQQSEINTSEIKKNKINKIGFRERRNLVPMSIYIPDSYLH